MGQRQPNVREWFAAEELERCDRRGQQTALKTRAGRWVICTECGPVGDGDLSLHAPPPQLEASSG